jgi:hypothetical protein
LKSAVKLEKKSLNAPHTTWKNMVFSKARIVEHIKKIYVLVAGNGFGTMANITGRKI